MFRFIARNYFSTVHAVIVTLRAMTSNNEISEQATSEKLGCQRVTSPCRSQMLTDDGQLQQNLMDFVSKFLAIQIS